MSKDWIILLTISLFTSFVWVGFETYQTMTDLKFAEIESEEVEPIDPTLDQKALEIVRSIGTSQIQEATSSSQFRVR
ncbi:MAG: hypothetical protein U9M98_01815 [Patescibacteria group bacterium]|nr:hypothetical protein [Patescibacteria group bacterium]